jgi:hypothetical protein
MSLTATILAIAADGERGRGEADDGIRTHDLRHGKATL